MKEKKDQPINIEEIAKTEGSEASQKQRMSSKKRNVLILVPILAVIFLVFACCLIGALLGKPNNDNKDSEGQKDIVEEVTKTQDEQDQVTEENITKEENVDIQEDTKPVPEPTEPTNTVPTLEEEKVDIQEETKPEPEPTETVSQKNAVKAAKSYIDYTAFSHDGLVKQLEYEQFSHADAVYGADNSGAVWNEQAVKAAKSYIDYSAFSRGSLIEQLKYEGFTQAQAEYGVDAIGL